jgi:hypothetical protein
MMTQARHWRSRGNHGARRTTAHFPSRPKNHTAFLGLYGKMRRHPPCAVVFLPRVPIFTPLAPLAAFGPARTLCRRPDC